MRYIRQFGLLAAAILVAAGTLCSCQPPPPPTPRPTLRSLWKDDAKPPKSLATPNGFKISPQAAIEAVRAGDDLSQKHPWHIYVDKKRYYIVNSVLGSNPQSAFHEGVIVDGETGKVIPRDQGPAELIPPSKWKPEQDATIGIQF